VELFSFAGAEELFLREWPEKTLSSENLLYLLVVLQKYTCINRAWRPA
jgi:hypothetical protein